MKTQPQAVSGLDPLLSIEDLAEYLGVPVTTIYDWRVGGKGPCGVRVGRHVKFTVSDVLAWIAADRPRSMPAPPTYTGSGTRAGRRRADDHRAAATKDLWNRRGRARPKAIQRLLPR